MERYVRQKLGEGMKLTITGSNASLLSKELGTKLTGRHVTKELFPFSYTEFNAFAKQGASPASVAEYLQVGGFPEYVKQRVDDILNDVLEDILIRDIAVRHSIRDVDSLQRLTLYLISNMIPTRYGWKEVKLGRVFKSSDCVPGEDGVRGEVLSSRYIAHLGGKGPFLEA